MSGLFVGPSLFWKPLPFRKRFDILRHSLIELYSFPLILNLRLTLTFTFITFSSLLVKLQFRKWNPAHAGRSAAELVSCNETQVSETKCAETCGRIIPQSGGNEPPKKLWCFIPVIWIIQTEKMYICNERDHRVRLHSGISTIWRAVYVPIYRRNTVRNKKANHRVVFFFAADVIFFLRLPFFVAWLVISLFSFIDFLKFFDAFAQSRTNFRQFSYAKK